MKRMAAEWAVLCLISWSPFALCALASVREWVSGDRRWKPPAWLSCLLALLLCLCMALSGILRDGPVVPAAALALMFLCVPAFVRRMEMPAGYVVYCLLPGVFTGLLLIMLRIAGWLPFHWAVTAVLLLGGGIFCCWACLRCLKRWVFPIRGQITAAEGFWIDAPGIIYLGLLLFFYYGDAAFGGSRYAAAVKLICCGFCFVGLWDAYRRNSRLLRTAMESVSQQNRAEFLEHSLRLQQDRYNTLVEQAEVARALRHDLRHHEMLINQYLCSGDREGLAAYAREFRQQQEQLRQEPSICANPVVDALARYYLGQMEKAGAELDVVLQIDERCTVPGADLCVVMGNCLENALEAILQAAPQRRYFRMRALQDGSMLTIVAENGYSGERLQDGTGFLSTKRAGRGVGLASMASIAEKYHGAFRVQAENGVFRVSAALFGQEGS